MPQDPRRSIAFIEAVQDNSTMRWVLFIVTISGIISVLWVIRHETATFLTVIVISIIGILKISSATRWRMSLREFSTAGSPLDPFGNRREWSAWPRNNYVNSITDRLQIAKDKHILLIGPTGAGKSVILNNLLPAKFENDEILGPFSEFENVAYTLLLRISEKFPNSELIDTVQRIPTLLNECQIDKVTDLSANIPKILRSAIADRNVLFLFDQVERYFIYSQKQSRSDPKRFKCNTAIIRAILKGLREIESVKTLFSIRSEFFFGSIGNLFQNSRDGQGLEKLVEFHFMWGINNEEDPEVYSAMASILDQKFSEGGRIPQQISRIAGFNSRLNSDSFALRLGGFLFFELYSKDRYRDRLNQSTSVEDLVDILLDASFEGTALSLHFESSERTVFDSILFALAAENQSTGNGCSASRLAGLTHFPVSEVVPIIGYLSALGLLKCHNKNGLENYRIAHDKIADRILRSEKLDIHSRGLNAIRSLTENEAKSSELTSPSHFPRYLETSVKEFFNISYLLVSAFIAFGIFRILFADQIYPYFDVVYEIFDFSALIIKFTGNIIAPEDVIIFFTAPEYYRSPSYYIPHFVVHVIWLSYIDRMNRSFLVFTSDKIGKRYASLLTSIGFCFGVYVAFLPQLFALPLFVVGVPYGWLSMRAARRSNFVGEIETIMSNWGRRTIINMFVMLIIGVSTGLWLVKVDLILGSETASYVAQYSLVYVTAGMLLWFWQHIRADQNTRRIWSANLSLYDKGRITRNKNENITT